MNDRKTFLIAGCGVSGRAAARLASSIRLSYSIWEQKDTEEIRDFIRTLPFPPEHIFLGEISKETLPRFSTVVLSPGIRETNPCFEILKNCADELVSEPGFALQFTDCPILAVTGTNGKTTTTELTEALLKACGFRALASGNIGYGLSDAVLAVRAGTAEVLVVEISSFQLEHIGHFAPDAAAVLNLASDHLDRHGSMEEYARLKFSLCSDSRTKAIFGRSLDEWRGKLFRREHDCMIFSSEQDDSDADFLYQDNHIFFRGKELFDCSKLCLRGKHNMENIMAALQLIVSWRGDDILKRPELYEALRSFRPDAHRMELFLEQNQIRYVNDSKATNPHAVNAALDAFPEPHRVILLLGGLDKDMIFEEMIPHAEPVKCAFLYGQCREKIRTALGEVFPCTLCDSFENAVTLACRQAVPGDVVMLSPATASMDMFKNYRERGDKFKELVSGIAGKA